MTLNSVILYILIGLAGLSPILTSTYVLQLKEWRFDRLKEEMQRQHVWKLFFGTRRTVLGTIWIIFALLTVSIIHPRISEIGFLILLTGMNIVQIQQKKQSFPMWTAKALVTTASASIILFFTTLCTLNYPLLQAGATFFAPIYVVASWITLMPIDWILKARLIKKATNLRLSHPHLTVIGITGSAGKTTTKELLAHILQTKNSIATPLHLNTDIGVARWLIKVLTEEPSDSTKILIIEMGAYKKGEIARLCTMTKPTIGVITSIGSQHLSLFGSRHAIIAAKSELFESLPTHGYAWMSSENSAYAELSSRCSCTIQTVSAEKQAVIRALDTKETSTGVQFSIQGTTFTCNLFGTQSVTSMLLAIGVAHSLGMTMEAIQQTLQTYTGLAHTFHMFTAGTWTILDDTYNASATSVLQAIEWAKTQAKAYKIFVLDGIIELGEDEARIHIDIAEKCKNIFQKLYIGKKHFLQYFPPSILGYQAKHISEWMMPTDTSVLLVCSGRIPSNFLPSIQNILNKTL